MEMTFKASQGGYSQAQEALKVPTACKFTYSDPLWRIS